MQLRGMFQNDWTAFAGEDDVRDALTGGDADAENPFVPGTELRRARIGVTGAVAPHVEMKLEYDFTGGSADPADVYVEFNGVPLLMTVRVGHQFEPENRLSGSSKYQIFMEKALPNAFTSGRNTGIRSLTTALRKRMTISAGAFLDTDGTGANGKDKAYNAAVRLTGLPFYRASGRELGHLGGFYGRQDPRGSLVRYHQRPDAHLAPYLVDTGGLTASAVDLLGFEAATILGSASLQGEYIRTTLHREGGQDRSFSGYYVTATWVATGESRAYSRVNGAFSRFVPRRPFDPAAGGYGAWMLLARYARLDLNDGDVRGGLLSDVTFGLNWYLSGNAQLMWNYTIADLADAGTMGIVQMRLQVQL